LNSWCKIIGVLKEMGKVWFSKKKEKMKRWKGREERETIMSERTLCWLASLFNLCVRERERE
jgi:hypothetical protein